MTKTVYIQMVRAILVVTLVSLTADKALADLVTGWGLETGFQNATLTEGAAGSFSVTQPTGNATPRANLSAPIDFSIVGEEVQLTGLVTFDGSQAFGNESFRIGLYNNNGNATGTLSGGDWSGATPTGWLGYMAEAGNGDGSGTSISVGRNATGNWFSGTGAYGLTPNGTQTGTYTSGTTATFSFDLTLTRLSATGVGLSYSFIDTTGGSGSDYSVTGSGVIDSSGASTAMTSFNEVGFLLNGSSGGAASFSGVTVSAVPEPATFSLLGVGALCLMLRRRV
jgi:PEP-CTERM motif